MNIAVLIKQVPETDSLVIDEDTGTVKRTGVESIINPLDLYALEAALNIKDTEAKTAVTAVSMGPKSAQRALKEALAMGADEAVLLNDKAFAGSDTFATSLILSTALKKLKKFNLIICGEKAVDGDTGQVGPEIAAFMDLDVITFVSKMEIRDNIIHAERITETGTEFLTAKMPVVITVTKALGEPRLPTLKGKKRAAVLPVAVLDRESLDISAEDTGLSGSPTRVSKITHPSVKRKSMILTPGTDEEIRESAGRIAAYLRERGLI